MNAQETPAQTYARVIDTLETRGLSHPVAVDGAAVIMAAVNLSTSLGGIGVNIRAAGFTVSAENGLKSWYYDRAAGLPTPPHE